MSTKAIFVKPGGGYQNVVVGHSEAPAPGAGEITVRLHANSLNYHDFAVVSGMWGPSEERIPMADGAGEVIAVGTDVSEFKVGDSVVSTFFPQWIELDGTKTVLYQNDHLDEMRAYRDAGPTYPIYVVPEFATITLFENVGADDETIVSVAPGDLPDGFADRTN